MVASLLLHECHRRGLVFRVDGDRLSCQGAQGAITPALTALIRQYKEDLIALVSPHGTPISPHGSPHENAMWTNWSDNTNSSNQDTSVDQILERERFSPPSPHERGDSSRVEGKFISQRPEGEAAQSEIIIPGVNDIFPLDECGLGGLEQRNHNDGNMVTEVHTAEKGGLTRGLAGVPCGLKPPETPKSPHRWRCLSPLCFHKPGWWLSPYGVLNCLNCVPPAFPYLVVIQGTADDSPEVHPDRSTVPTADALIRLRAHPVETEAHPS